MPEFTVAAGQTVASDIRNAFESLDRAVHDAAQLASNFVEACKGSDLPPSRSQRVLKSLADSMTKAVESRADMIQAQRTMVSIKDNSNLEVYDFGCWMDETQKPAIPSFVEMMAAPPAELSA